MNYTVVIDPGHGGNDPGAVYNGRKEKDDTLNLALAVGNILEENGINVVYTRTSDVYETPFTKATKGNEAGADFFISIHRNSSEKPNEYNGTSTLIFDNAGIKKEMAANINAELKKVGYNDLGTDIRPNLVVLKRTKMPAILVEAGFINSDKDNALFDEEFYDTADAIAKGILKTLRKQEEYVKNTSTEQKIEAYKENTDNINSDNNMECICDREEIYRVQTGAFENQANADTMLNRLLMEDIPAFIIYENGLYKVQVGAYKKLDNAVKMERRLRRMGYNTYITT
ncbi:N-acetylmuramoyl-L-alanine amidase [Falcatimonas sp. MSJ-15]|uniref:N-acetylmuramoyl-L-alanine amidase n=1 Tax=Falcatimonas sp. MSJ-15 TaxID=2841515 RepID=UPI001C126062|nr:N-acetylmuramoyl-L-alanine amidase [Falcatimonas sp. MSJ-15]MBU5471561.1 N-acetylmuramoyl-L-alanine amidase [Falcatimonas sp. MSJ-15]